MKINVISESAFTVQGHGVHSAFTDTVEALRKYTSSSIATNTNRVADVVHTHTIGPYSVWKLLRTSGVRVVSAHVTPASFVGSLIGAKYWYPLAAWYLRWLYNRADGVLAVSQEVIDELKRMGVHKPLYLVPNTIETSQFKHSAEARRQLRAKHGIPQDAFVVLGNGQVQPRKRIDTFVKAARELPDVWFVWVGGIPFKKLAADSADMLKVMENHPKNVVFTGLVDRKAAEGYYHAADLFFLPSIQETFGIVIIEAAAAGLPVLLRDLPQYRVTFGEGYEKGTDASFVKAIKRFSEDKAYRKQWADRAAGIAKRYDAKAGADRLMQVYGELLETKRGVANQKAEA